MKNIIIQCDSGVCALVSAASIQVAQAAWDALVRRDDAEPGYARWPEPGEVRAISRDGDHDYR